MFLSRENVSHGDVSLPKRDISVWGRYLSEEDIFPYKVDISVFMGLCYPAASSIEEEEVAGSAHPGPLIGEGC